LAYRKNSTEEVFLLTQIADLDQACKEVNGHTIVSTLLLPVIPIDEKIGVGFDCYDPTGTVIKGDPVIGVFKKSDNQVLATPAERAWLVDPATKSFQAVPDLACRSFE